MILSTFDYAVFCVARSGPKEGLKICVGAKTNSTIFKVQSSLEKVLLLFLPKSGKGRATTPPPPPPPVPTVLLDIAVAVIYVDAAKKVMLEFRIACEAEVSADFKTSRNFILTHVLAKPLNSSISFL